MKSLVHRALPVLRSKPVRLVARALFNKETIFWLKSKLLPRDFVYDAEYFIRDIDGPATESAATIADSVKTDLGPRTVIDVGCGTGALLVKLRDAGSDVLGLEHAEAARAMCHDRGLDVRPFDIIHDTLDTPQTYDVAISMEVAEHLPADAADRYVDLLVRLAKAVVFTAAPPNQGGTAHINEQPHEYWINKFHERGHALDWTLTSRWRKCWRDSGEVQSWYYNNLLVFRSMTDAASPIGLRTTESV